MMSHIRNTWLNSSVPCKHLDDTVSDTVYWVRCQHTESVFMMWEHRPTVIPAMRAGWLGWQHRAVTAVWTSMTTSACLGFRCRLSRFHMQTHDLSVLQDPSSILLQKYTDLNQTAEELLKPFPVHFIWLIQEIVKIQFQVCSVYIHEQVHYVTY